jgi:hypothetical protein
MREQFQITQSPDGRGLVDCDWVYAFASPDLAKWAIDTAQTATEQALSLAFGRAGAEKES